MRSARVCMLFARVCMVLALVLALVFALVSALDGDLMFLMVC